MIDPFVHSAKAQTMQRDITALCKAIRSFDAEASDKALDYCERWFTLLSCEEHAELVRRYSNAPKVTQDQTRAILGMTTPKDRERECAGKPWRMDGIGRVTYGDDS